MALRDLQEGEELCISYIDATANLADRRAALQGYGFLCRCSTCVSEEGERRRKEREEEELDNAGASDETPEKRLYEASAEDLVVGATVSCPRVGHRIVPNGNVPGKAFPATRRFGACDVCEARGTQFRCAGGCDFDLCRVCFKKQAAARAHESLAAFADRSIDNVKRAALVLAKNGVVALPRVAPVSVIQAVARHFEGKLAAVEKGLKERGLSLFGGDTFAFSEVCWRGDGRIDMRLDISEPPVARLLDHIQGRVRLGGIEAREADSGATAGAELSLKHI